MRCLTGNLGFFENLLLSLAEILIFDEALIVHDKDDIQLTSGKMSNFYINLKQVALHSIGGTILGRLVYEWIAMQSLNNNLTEFQHIVGKELGAVPLIVATALTIEQNGGSTNCLVVKKQPKNHGVAKWVEGKFKKGDNVLVIDDVLTTGSSVIDTINKCKEAGLNVIQGLVIIQRGTDDDLQKIKAETGITVDYLLSKDELIDYAKKRDTNNIT